MHTQVYSDGEKDEKIDGWIDRWADIQTNR